LHFDINSLDIDFVFELPLNFDRISFDTDFGLESSLNIESIIEVPIYITIVSVHLFYLQGDFFQKIPKTILL